LGLHLRSFVTTTKPQPSLNHNLKSVPLVLTGDTPAALGDCGKPKGAPLQWFRIRCGWRGRLKYRTSIVGSHKMAIPGGYGSGWAVVISAA